jgi:hypothetical protein
VAENDTGDRHRSAAKVLHEIQRHEDFPKGPVERIEIHILASGEVTWRVWEPRAEEPVGGLLPQPE